jgi:hypothetical protein
MNNIDKKYSLIIYSSESLSCPGISGFSTFS